ncbi:MAG TPA: ribose-phosphate diphosphokinase [Allosphingosinicella sp.]|nr:ribose-phosphate diphosphokinase [Allosphingosinicella sp.]
MTADPGPLLFALDPDVALGERMAARLGRPLARHEERDFGGGEHKIRPLEEVGGRDVHVLHSLYGDPEFSANDKTIRLLFFIGALKDAGAARVTAIAPYLAYSRKDRRTKPRDPISTRYLAGLFEAVGTDAVVTLEVHNVAAFENAFRTCRPTNVAAAGLLAAHIARTCGEDLLAVVTPDTGGAKRAELLRRQLERMQRRDVSKAIMDKHRSMGVVSGNLFAGDVADRTAIIVDDMIASGTTILRAAAACREAGATRVVAAAVHALFAINSPLFGPGGPDRILVTDSVPLPTGLGEAAGPRLEVVGAADLLADVVARLHWGNAVSDLLPWD